MTPKRLFFTVMIALPVLFFASAGIGFAQTQTCNAPLIDDISHQGARIQWTSSATATFQRVLYGTTTSYGSIQGVAQAAAVSPPQLQGVSLSGLAANTTYHISAQSSADNTNWCNGPDATFTTLPLPFPHPAYPTPPVQFDTATPPVVTGGTCTATDAASFQSCLNSATFGSQIVIPAGTVIPSTGFTTPAAPDALTISAINTSTGTLTTSTSHGFSNGQAIRFASDYYVPNPINVGYTYYVKNATATTFQISTTNGGAAIASFGDAGLGTTRVIQWPIPPTQYITIRTSTPDSQLPPPGVRLDPMVYGSKLAVIQQQQTYSGRGVILFGTLAHHYWFTGIEFTTGSLATAGQSTDPQPYNDLFSTAFGNANIVVDRSWFHGLGYPNRLQHAWFPMDGSNVAIVHSFADNIVYWRPWKTGLNASTTSTALTVQPGAFHLGSSTCSLLANAGANISGGSVSGTAYLYYDMGCNLTLNLPSGVTASGTGITIVNSSSPTWPVDSLGRVAAGKMATISVGSGAFLGVSDVPSYGYSVENTEGSGAFDILWGPGPTKLENNYIEGAGIPVFWADDPSMSGACYSFCPLLYTQTDATVRRNTITALLSHIVGTPLSDGRAYAHRNNLEFKNGKRILVEGNILSNSFMENNQGPVLILNPNASNTPFGLSSINEITDAEIRYNTFYGNAQLSIRGGHAPSGRNLAKSMKRYWQHDNLSYANNAWKAAAKPYDGALTTGMGSGQYISSGYGVEDLIDEHNTVYDSRGTFGVIMSILTQFGDGLTLRNNIYSVTSDSGYSPFTFASTLAASGGTCCGSATVPDYNSYGGSDLIGALPLGSWNRNVLLGSYKISGPPGSEVEMQQSDINSLASSFPGGGQTFFPSGQSFAARTAAVGWFNTSALNFRVASASPYVSGGVSHALDGLDIGANIDSLEAAQGKVSNVHVFAIGSNAATVGFLAPDSYGCTVDWSANSWASFTRVANAGGGRAQNVALLSLPGASTIMYRVNCAVMQPTGVFSTK